MGSVKLKEKKFTKNLIKNGFNASKAYKETYDCKDISAYGKNCISDLGDYNIVGVLESKEIKQIIADLETYKFAGIDEITFCWSELYVFEDRPRTFAYRTTPFKINKNTPSLFNYEGWTIEFYPLGKKTNEFKELRISSIARSQAWIKASWNSCIGV